MVKVQRLFAKTNLKIPVCRTRSQQGLGQDRVCDAQRSNESPSGAFKRQRGLRQQMEGRCPDKHAPARKLSHGAGNFQELKICAHGTILDLTVRIIRLAPVVIL